MKINNYELKEEILESKEFVEELIYENIRLMEEIAQLELENMKLRIRAEAAERHGREAVN